ncbi:MULTISPECIES: SRPBCC family protein [Arenibacter]|uniref:SRPBCC family protein n=1 Tax=Arenibacter TaxID=178469 RepID=UPI00130002EA|nr:MULTISPECIES: SRPBCC family protein [Arenibacter]
MEKQETSVVFPTADKWVKSPLRNLVKLELNAPTNEVWALVGDPSNMPKFSEGLEKVETVFDNTGKCTGYTCFFKPMSGEDEGIVHHTTIAWHEENKGWASIDLEDNPFGMLQSLSLMTLEPYGVQTIFVWQFHFNCENEDMLNFNTDGYKNALDDISQRLIKRFGGRQLENYVKGG